jgi:hypothetical protein
MNENMHTHMKYQLISKDMMHGIYISLIVIALYIYI